MKFRPAFMAVLAAALMGNKTKLDAPPAKKLVPAPKYNTVYRGLRSGGKGTPRNKKRNLTNFARKAKIQRRKSA